MKRRLLSNAYGGALQSFICAISAGRNIGPGQRRLSFPELSLNPSIPTTPGQPGTFFCSRLGILEGPERNSVFIKTEHKRNLWSYLGEYKFALHLQGREKLKGNMFKKQKPDVCAIIPFHFKSLNISQVQQQEDVSIPKSGASTSHTMSMSSTASRRRSRQPHSSPTLCGFLPRNLRTTWAIFPAL